MLSVCCGLQIHNARSVLTAHNTQIWQDWGVILHESMRHKAGVLGILSRKGVASRTNNSSTFAAMTLLKFCLNTTRNRLFSTAVHSIVCQNAMEKNNAYLLTLLVCPLSKGPLEFDKASNCLLSQTANVAYPLSKEGCINMTVHDAHIIKTGTTEWRTETTDRKLDKVFCAAQQIWHHSVILTFENLNSAAENMTTPQIRKQVKLLFLINLSNEDSCSRRICLFNDRHSHRPSVAHHLTAIYYGVLFAFFVLVQTSVIGRSTFLGAKPTDRLIVFPVFYLCNRDAFPCATKFVCNYVNPIRRKFLTNTIAIAIFPSRF